MLPADAKDDGKTSKKTKKHQHQQQSIPSLDDTNVWPDPSTAAEKEVRMEPAATAAPVSKKDKGKWTPVTPNITHTTPASGSKNGHHHHHRHHYNTSSDTHNSGNSNDNVNSHSNSNESHPRRRKSSVHASTETKHSGNGHHNNHSSTGINGAATTTYVRPDDAPTAPPHVTPMHGRRASVPSIFDEEPTPNQRHQSRRHNGRGRE